MTRTTWLAALIAAVTIFGATGQAQAQTTGTRVGVVNIGTVFTKYKKALDFKTEMEKTLAPYKEKAEKIKKDVGLYQGGIEDPKTDPKTKEAYGQAIRALKRQLEDLDLEARKSIGSKQETHLIQLYKEVSEHIQRVAAPNGFHLVLGFGEPPLQDLLTIGNVNRKLTAMDMGAMVPLYFNTTIDISEAVVSSLNAAYVANGSTLGSGGAVTQTGLQK